MEEVGDNRVQAKTQGLTVSGRWEEMGGTQEAWA